MSTGEVISYTAGVGLVAGGFAMVRTSGLPDIEDVAPTAAELTAAEPERVVDYQVVGADGKVETFYVDGDVHASQAAAGAKAHVQNTARFHAGHGLMGAGVLALVAGALFTMTDRH